MIVENVILAFAEIANVTTLTLMIVGVAAGLLAGAIPGFTIAMAIVLTLPFTFGMPPSQGLATMVSVLVGGLSGGLMAGIMFFYLSYMSQNLADMTGTAGGKSGTGKTQNKLVSPKDLINQVRDVADSMDKKIRNTDDKLKQLDESQNTKK